MRIRLMTLLLAAVALPMASLANDIVTRNHDYKVGEKVHEGFVAYDAEQDSPRGAVLIVHQWLGVSDHEREIAKRLAAEGYFAFCADIYGKETRPAGREDAGQFAGAYRGGDRQNFRDSLSAALEELSTAFPDQVDTDRIVAIGYCFGGTGVLELARMNAPVKGVASFHGGLGKGEGPTAGTIKPRVLVLHGQADPGVPPAEVQGLKDELDAAKADWELVAYGGAVHSFTDKKANSDRARYDPKADARSWQRLQDYLNELIDN